MAQAIPYLAFDGNCAEAMRLYEAVLGLGAKLETMMSGSDSPMAAHIPPEHAQRILHARLRFNDGSYIYAGDAAFRAHAGYDKGVMLTMNYPSTAEAERVFAALSAGGKVVMALAPMFWPKCAGMLVDKIWHIVEHQWRSDDLIAPAALCTALRAGRPRRRHA